MKTELYLKRFATEISKERGIEECSEISIIKGIQSGNGYIGEFIKVRVEGRNDVLHIVVKVSKKNDLMRAVVPVDEAFNNESVFYKTIFPAMKVLQEQLRIRNIFNCVPQFFKLGEYFDESYIAMEDLTESGFSMFDIKKDINEEHLEMICKLFGRFHALSFAFKHFEPEFYKKIVGELQCVHTGFLRYKGGLLKQCVSVIKKALDARNSSNKMMDYYYQNIESTYKNILSNTKKDRYSCIIHYDGWLNNMMFKYCESKGRESPIDIKLFDWQTCNVGSPAIDLSIVLYAIASETILENLDKYLKIYHCAFEAFLTQTGLKIHEVYPFEVLKEQWQKYSEYGLIRGLLVHKIRTNIMDAGGNFEDAINAEFDVEKMQRLLNDLLKHMECIGVF